MDQVFRETNRESTERMRRLNARLSDTDLQRPVGEHWTVAVAFAHLAFWDARVLAILDASEAQGQPVIHTIDLVVNDLSLPLWRAIPPRDAVEIAIALADSLDQRLETTSPELLEQIFPAHPYFIRRDIHRSEHLDEIEQALTT